MKWLTRIQAIVFKEIRQLSRDRLTFAMIVVLPLAQLTLFGYAINNDVRHIPVAVVDQSQSQASRMLVEAVKATQTVDFVVNFTHSLQAQDAIQAGEIRAALVIPKDLEQRMAQGKELGQWLVDGTDSVIGQAVLALRNMPFTLYSKIEPFNHRMATTPTFDVALYYNPSRRTAINIVPGLLAVILTMTMVLFTSIAIVREREKGNLELLITTPVHSLELMIAKIIPYILVGIIQVVIVLGLGYLIFDVPINGEPTQILLGALLFICASLTLGLLISTVTKTQLQAMQMTLFILLPSILLSGFMFPYEGMPNVAQLIAEALPATHFMRIIRGIVLRSADLMDMWKDALWLFVFTIVGLVFASLRFNKSLD